MDLTDIFLFFTGFLIGAVTKYAGILLGTAYIIEYDTDNPIFKGLVLGLMVSSIVDININDKTEVVIKCDKENQKDSV